MQDSRLLLAELRRDPAFRRARCTVRAGSGESKHLIIGIGQMHPVLSGRFEGFQARKIARIQAWMYNACRVIRDRTGVKCFGQEGLAMDGERGGTFRLPDDLLAVMRREIGGDPAGFLLRTAAQWRAGLRRGDARQAQLGNIQLNGLAVLQALDDGVSIFPIEQQDVHGVIGQAINTLQRELEAIERSGPFQSAVAKGGKGLTRDEVAAIRHRNATVTAFNRMLNHPERNRSILREVLERAQHENVTVFVLGEAHRSGMLRLAKEHVPADTTFVWITPPQLWWWKAMASRCSWLILGLLFVVGLMSLQ